MKARDLLKLVDELLAALPPEDDEPDLEYVTCPYCKEEWIMGTFHLCQGKP